MASAADAGSIPPYGQVDGGGLCRSVALFRQYCPAGRQRAITGSDAGFSAEPGLFDLATALARYRFATDGIGKTTLNGVTQDNAAENTRLGLVLGFPIGGGFTVKLNGTTGLSTSTGNDFDTLTAQVFYAW